MKILFTARKHDTIAADHFDLVQDSARVAESCSLSRQKTG